MAKTNKDIFGQVLVALVTPMTPEGEVDWASTEKHIDYVISNGADGVVVTGTTGETSTLTDAEKIKLVEVGKSVAAGRAKIITGGGSNETAHAMQLYKQSEKAGADGVMIVTPYYNKPTQLGIIEHYKYIASCTKLPIIMYNVPGRTGSNMLAETTIELAKIDNIVAMKEASGNMEQIMEVIRLKPEGFGVLSGDDALTMPLIAAGADGVISVVANALPEKFSSMVNASIEENLSKARKEHYELLPITKMFFEEGNPGGVKVALAKRGVLNSHMRLPLVQVSLDLKNRIEKEMELLLEQNN